jgi:putative acetyltransferase
MRPDSAATAGCLETGAQPYFEPARMLYAKHGFRPCSAFADYRDDPNTVFLARPLG